MKNFVKSVLSVVLAIILCEKCAFGADSINKVISNSNIPKSAISVSVKDFNSGKTIFSLNSDKPVIPASTLKLVTSAASLDMLTPDYMFRTELYKSTNNDLYFKLGADPYLSYKDLKKILSTAKNKNIIEPKTIYFDDYILDSVNWGEGWQWDDDLNPLMQKFGPYNLDGNLITIIVKPNTDGAPASVYTEKFYPLTFMNLVTTGGKKNKLKISHNTSIASSNVLQVEGNVATMAKINIPVDNMKRYFRLRVEEGLASQKIHYYGKMYEKKLPSSNVYLVDFVEHPITDAVKDILQKSDNMTAETVFKIAGGKYVGNTGSYESAKNMLYNYLTSLGIPPETVKIVDGSGVSKNNLVTADFMTTFLIKQAGAKDFELWQDSMATPGIGTLKDRMLYFGENLKAKTGTLSDVSAIAGYIKTQRGRELVFDIMINDPSSKDTDKKLLEEFILRSVFENN